MKTTNKLTTAAAAVAVALAIPATALAADRNDDGIPDGWEKRHGLSLGKDQAKRDQDRDALRNLGEYRNRTNPRSADTDRDGLEDGAEISSGNDPRDPDSDDDGVGDGSETTGSVLSYDGTSGVLVIDTPGGRLSGVVNELTEIKCDDGSGPSSSSSSTRSNDDGPGHDAGDDSGGDGSDDGPGHDTGDDSGGDSAGGVCTVADLVPGARVHGAELTSGGFWHEIELAR